MKLLFCWVVAVSSLSGATIVTEVTCPGTGAIYGSASVRCPAPFAAAASISYSAFYRNSVLIAADTGGPQPHHEDGSAAYAIFIDDYVLTVTGGAGYGLVAPCLTAPERYSSAARVKDRHPLGTSV